MRLTRILLLVVLASAIAGAFASSASALGFEDEPCPINVDPANPQLKVCHPDAQVGKFISYAITGKGGCTPTYVKYDVVGGTSLPPGLSLNSSNGNISGIPTQAGAFKFWLQISDHIESWCADTKQSQWQFEIIVDPSLQIVQRQSSLTPAQMNTPYNLQLTASGAGSAPLTWSVVAGSGSLPAGLTLNSSTGAITGTATTMGDYRFQIQVSDGTRSDAQTYTLSVVEPLKVTSSPAVAGELGQNLDTTLTASGGRQPYTWAVANGTTLPNGLTLNASTGAITGTPTSPGVSPVNVTVTDSLGLTQTFDLRIAVAQQVELIKRSLRTAKVGHAYSARLFATGGVAPKRWKIVAGSLPAGLRLNATTGVISGTARRAGTAHVTVQVTDNLGAVSKATFTLRVLA
jgi:large repetitive protein